MSLVAMQARVVAVLNLTKVRLSFPYSTFHSTLTTDLRRRDPWGETALWQASTGICLLQLRSGISQLAHDALFLG